MSDEKKRILQSLELATIAEKQCRDQFIRNPTNSNLATWRKSVYDLRGVQDRFSAMWSKWL